MTTVVEIPEGLERALEVFRPHFGAPAFEHFKHYVLGLIVSEKPDRGGYQPNLH